MNKAPLPHSDSTARSPVVRFLRRVAGAVLLGTLLATGCVARQQALVTTQKLKTSSEQAAGVVLLAKTNEAATVRSHRDLRQAYRQLAERTWQNLLEIQQRGLEVEYQKALGNLEAERARLLEEARRGRVAAEESAEQKLTQHLADLDRGEATLEAQALEARRKSKDAPNDLPLLQKSLEVDAAYFAVAAKARDIELRARSRLGESMRRADQTFADRLQSATKAQREKLGNEFQKWKDKLTGSKMPEINLGPEPEGNPAFYDSVILYLNSTQQAGRALEDYLESNWFGRQGLLAEYLRAAGGGLISGALRSDVDLRASSEALSTAAKSLGQDMLSELKDAGQTALKTLGDEGRELLRTGTEELARSVSDSVRDATKK